MILKEAVEIMKAHNEWRRGAETEMVNPKELGVAIDVLINHAEAGGKSAEDCLNNNKPYGRNWSDFLLPDQMEFLYRAMEQYAHQQPGVFAVTTDYGIKYHPTDLSNVMKPDDALFIGTGYECACFIRDHKPSLPSEEIKDNKIMLLEEDIWCVHKYFDDIKIPKSCKNGQQYSIVGRIKRLEERYLKQMSELESQYAHQQPDGAIDSLECTCKLTDKNHALCPVCDKEEYKKSVEQRNDAIKNVDERTTNKELISFLISPGKPFKINIVRDLFNQYYMEEISLSRLNERLNEIVFYWKQPVNDGWEGAHNIDDTEPPKQ